MKYGKKPQADGLLGMLYVVEVRLMNERTREKIKHKILLVGCEHADIERKIRWLFDGSIYKQISIKGIEKVREKVHFLNTIVTQYDDLVGPVIEREERSQIVIQNKILTEPYDPRLYAVGVTTTMLAKDEEHALRKVGHALISHATPGQSHSGANLSDDSTIAIEELSRSSAYAKPRDVSEEVNKAHFVQG